MSGETIRDISPADLKKMLTYSRPEAIGPEIKNKPPKSPSFVDKLLEDVRAKNTETQRQPYQLENDDQIDQYANDLKKRAHMPSYLTDFFDESVRDAIDNKARKRETDTLKKMHDTSASIAAGIQVDNEDRKQVEEYINTQYNFWKNRAQASGGEEQKNARENQGVLRAFQMALENPTVLEDIANPPTEEAALHKMMEDHTQPAFPEFVFHPDKSQEFVALLQGEKINLDTLEGYITEARKDLYAQEKTFRTDNASLIAAVKGALEYKDAHKGITDDITVIVQDGKVIYKGDKQGAPATTKGQTFYFTPTEYVGRPHSLALHHMQLDNYEIRAGDADRAIDLIRTLKQSPSAVIESVDDWLSITRLLDLHRAYIATLNDGTLPSHEAKTLDKQLNTLNGFSKLTRKRISPQLKERLETEPKGKVGSFFTRAGKRLKRLGQRRVE